jgi:hypothetical protein
MNLFLFWRKFDLVKRAVTLFIDGEAYQALRKAVYPKKVSQEVEDLMRKRVAELEGKQYEPQEQVDLGALKRDHARLIIEVDRLEKWLRKQKAYDDLGRLAVKLGLTPDLRNLDEVAPKLLDEYKGLKEDTHQFLSLLETVKAKREVERKLDEIRIMRAASKQAPV